MVSVILASFNHEAYVAEAVSSVLAQSFGDLELIVVDDASSDGTADIVAAISDPRVTLVRNQFNRAIHPRNLALDLARGHYVAFQNSDDVWAPEKLALQVAAMAASAHRVCFTGVEIIDGEGRRATDTWAEGAFKTENATSEIWLRRFFEGKSGVALPSAMMRSDDLRRLGGFRGSLVQLSDFDLWVRAAATGELVVLSDPLTRLRIIDGVNQSRPTPGGMRRTAIEFAEILGHFTEPALLRRFPEIFPDLPDPQTPGARKVVLAERTATTLGAGGLLFADRTIASVLDDRDERADAVAALGADYLRRFLDRRSEMTVVLVPPDESGPSL